MALANDNHWGYVAALIKRYKVRWIEMVAVLPYWTCMIVYYVEGDYGHLMNEEVQGTRQRTAVRGQAFSFLMPWEQIVKGLTQRVKAIPRDPECLKYMLRLHLKVASQDFHSHLKQVHLRPQILVLLLQELIARKHEACASTLAAAEFQRAVGRMNDRAAAAHARSLAECERLVYALYPETEGHVPLE